MTKENNEQQQPASDLPEVQQELSKVAANPKQSIIILVIACLAVGYFIFNFFIAGKSDDKEPKLALPTEVAKPVQTNINEIPPIPQLPEPPKLVEPDAPPPPPVPATNTDIPPPPPLQLPGDSSGSAPKIPSTDTGESVLPSKLTDSEEAKKRKETKRKSSIVLIAGTTDKKTPEQMEQEVDFKKRGDLEFLLGRGKIINAVLETAINTDFGGEVRALISRDVYSESGKIILIPKGTRVFGTYATTIKQAYGRIEIEWNRIDLASGYTINLQGNGVDDLGRKGIQGRVDNKYKERLTNAVLMSAFNIGAATAIDKLVPPPADSQTATANQAAAQQLNNIALSIYSDATKTPDQKIQLICSSVLAAIPDKTSTGYTNFNATCTNLNTATVGSTPDQKLSTLMASVNTAASALLINTATAITLTKSQEAAKQAFADITDTVKDMVTQQEFKPTITIEQGTSVKIYVNKDYKFPKAAVGKSRVMK